ncbi:MAG: FkbM family methyltransferase [Bacteroidia bacterium]|nr:FkbM family methyltransferase [Bacteroidia bacterium]
MNKKIGLKTKFFNTLRTLFKNQLAERIIRKITNGSSAGSFLSKIPANNYQYSSPTIRKVNIEGLNFELDISDYMEWLLYFGIRAEPREKLYELVRDKKIIFDIGANFGETALFFAKYAPSDAKIYVFEPESFCFRKLVHNLSLNAYNNIFAFNFGFGNENGKFYLASDTANNRGGNRIQLEANMPANIEIKRIDDFVEQEKIEKVDFIKIDVEGFEYHVLKGGENVIRRDKPTLFVEVNDKNLKAQKSSAVELISFLEKYYSHIYAAQDNRPITSKTNFEGLHFDVIAIT